MQVLGLILSDVIGDPLEVIASGPTVPQHTDTAKALRILDKYGLLNHSQHPSVSSYLESAMAADGEIGERRSAQDCLNLIIGSNKMATASAKDTAMALGYTSFVWSRSVQGEAAVLGELYATLAHYLILKRQAALREELKAAWERLHDCSSQLAWNHPSLSEDVSNLMRMVEVVVEGGGGQPLCLIGAGEPTVTVRGGGRGGRNQELALSYALKLHQLLCGGGGGGGSRDPRDAAASAGEECVFACVGTDGQDGPHGDAAGAKVDARLVSQALEQGLDPAQSLLDNDSYTFFSKLNSGSNLIKTGLTGTNVMDIHVLLIR